MVTRAKVFFRQGQSNSRGAAGNSTLESQYKQTFDAIRTWEGTIFGSLRYSVNNQYPTPTNLGGSEFALLKAMWEYYNTPIFDIKYGIGGTSLYVDWDSSVRGELFDKAMSNNLNAIAYMWNVLKIRKYDFCLIWDQKESDCNTQAWADAYYDKFTLFHQNFWKNFDCPAFTDSKKWTILHMANDNQPLGPYASTVKQAQEDLATDIPFVFKNYCESYSLQQPQPNNHYDMAGYKDMGLYDANDILIANQF